MSAKRGSAFFTAWVVSVVIAGALGTAYGQRSGEAVPTKFFTGDDIGFRIEAVRGETPLGRLVVRVDGKWVEVQFSGKVIPVK